MKPLNAKRYAAYKDSGVEWIGVVPEKWKIVRLKDLGYLQNGISKSGDYFGFGFPFVSYGNVYNNSVSSEKIKTYANSTFEDQQTYSCRKGDVFFTRTSETIEEIGFSATCLKTIPKSVFSGFVIRFRPTSVKLTEEFSKFYFSANILRYFFSKEVAIVTRASLGQGLLNKLPVILPPLTEQIAIAAYLDTKTAQIDRQIDLLGQKATQYGKLKQSLINETVTHGLDKSVTMKDSGVEWLGDVPKHWEVKRLKDLFTERSQKGYPDEPLLIASQTLGVTLKSSYSRNTMTVQDDFHLMKLVKKNDFVISLRSFEGGIEMASHRGIISAAYTILFSIDAIHARFYKHLFKSTIFISLLVTCTTGIREGRNVNYQQFKRELLPIPPLQEQTSIATYLDKKTAQIDRIVTTINEQIDKLKDLRKALINDVVTGKIKVVSEGQVA